MSFANDVRSLDSKQVRTLRTFFTELFRRFALKHSALHSSRRYRKRRRIYILYRIAIIWTILAMVLKL
ncbi:MAG TPA: hypothetical protein VG103_09935 [Chthoniobacterales bacterium]|nr:hypothetical protein [Chthoniobacterales bacterium]